IMHRVFEKSSFTFLIVMLTVTLNIGCVLSVIEQHENTDEKPQQTIFTVIDTKDVKNPSLVSSIHLPFRSGLNNNVILSDKYAYVTTETELLVIDISNPHQPSYQTSISFPEKIGKAHVSDDHVVVASKNKFYLVDCSNPLQPILQSKASLHHSNTISEFDINDSYLYVKDVNNYLHIFQLTNDTILPIKTVEIELPSGLVAVKAMGADVEQILLKNRTAFEYSRVDLSNQTDLLEFNCIHQIMRRSNDYLVFASRRYTCRDITIVLDKDRDRPYLWNWLEEYNIEANYLAHLYLTGEKKLPEGIPTNAYHGDRNKIQFVSQDQWSHTIDYEPFQLLGFYTDFQIKHNYLYVTYTKGVITIINLKTTDSDRFVSAISLKSQLPSSVAVGNEHVYVVASPEENNE
ncbi:hypothetical protein F4212_02735, partial [Candidatus Poribacteria bacterium]|nr:hypothetical protein [Candidatus Poribacteria bacterium]